MAFLFDLFEQKRYNKNSPFNHTNSNKVMLPYTLTTILGKWLFFLFNCCRIFFVNKKKAGNMRTIFGFKQLEALEKGLDLVDLYILEYILHIYAEDKNKINIENNYFSKINYLDLVEELPILKINTKKSVKCRLFNLQKKNLIFRCCQREGQKVYTLVMPNTQEIFKIV